MEQAWLKVISVFTPLKGMSFLINTTHLTSSQVWDWSTVPLKKYHPALSGFFSLPFLNFGTALSCWQGALPKYTRQDSACGSGNGAWEGFSTRSFSSSCAAQPLQELKELGMLLPPGHGMTSGRRGGLLPQTRTQGWNKGIVLLLKMICIPFSSSEDSGPSLGSPTSWEIVLLYRADSGHIETFIKGGEEAKRWPLHSAA